MFVALPSAQKQAWPFVLNKASDQANGLVGYWPMVVGGSQALDMSGKFNHGTLSGYGTPWKLGNGGGRSLNCQNDGKATLTVSSALQLTTAVTITAWISATSMSQYGFIAGLTTPANGVNGYGIYATSTTQIGFFSNLYSTVISLTLPTDGTWHHVVGIWNGTSNFVYLDGGKVAPSGISQTTTLSYTGVSAILGKMGSGFSGNFFGKIEDVCIYNRAFSTHDIVSKYDPATRWQLRYQPRRRVFVQGVAGGSTLTASVTDYVGLSDTLSRLSDGLRQFEDPLGLADSLASQSDANRNPIDYTGLADTISRLSDAYRQWEDPLGISDLFDRLASGNRQFEDPLGGGDTYARISDAYRTISESLGLSDSVTAQLIAAGTALTVAIVDYLGLADNVSYQWLIFGAAMIAIVDGLGIDDAAQADLLEAAQVIWNARPRTLTYSGARRRTVTG